MQPEKRKINKVKLFIVLAAIAVVVLFILQNLEEDDPYILIRRVPMPRALLLGIAVAIGFVAGLLTATFRKRK